MTGGDAIVDSLLRHGVDTVFGLPGVQVYGLFDAFARNANRLRLINARHEQTTAYMAMGYAASTGKPGVYSVVPGPGVLNTTAALATGWGIDAPMLCITGQVPSAQIGRGRGQLHELPGQLATLKTLLKFAERIEHPTDAPQVMARAFQAMTSGRPGPVAVEVPWDMFPATAEVTPQDPIGKLTNPTPDPEKITALAKLADAAKMPMIWVGGGAAHASAEILALAERLGAPVVSFRTGRGVLDSRHPLSLNVNEATRLCSRDSSNWRRRRQSWLPSGSQSWAKRTWARLPKAPAELPPRVPSGSSISTWNTRLSVLSPLGSAGLGAKGPPPDVARARLGNSSRPPGTSRTSRAGTAWSRWPASFTATPRRLRRTRSISSCGMAARMMRGPSAGRA